MALINCPECASKISDSAHFCPHCGYVLNNTYAKATEEQPMVVSSKSKNNPVCIPQKVKDIFHYIFAFEWAEDIFGILASIPIIGWPLAIVFIGVILFGTLALILYLGGLILSAIAKFSAALVAFILFVAGIGFAYYASYINESRKKWFFWVGLALFGPCAVVSLMIALIDIFK